MSGRLPGTTPGSAAAAASLGPGADRAFDLVCFDLDGTLVDTAGEICEAANRTLDTLGIPREPESAITALIGGGTRTLMTRLIERCQERGSAAAVPPLDQVFMEFDRHYERTTGSQAQPYPGALVTLQRLRVAGVRVACVTNKEFRHTVRVLKCTGLGDQFDLVLGGDSLPEKKPHASVLSYAATALGAATQRVAHVGDSAIDVQAARNAGVAAWAVPWGYNGGRPVAEADPDRLFATLAEVADFVLSTPQRLASAP